MLRQNLIQAQVNIFQTNFKLNFTFSFEELKVGH